MLYRDGREIVDSGTLVHMKSQEVMPGLVTEGVFGPILGTVLVDTAHGKLAWSHWEQGQAGPEAVFRYVIPKNESHYEVNLSGIFTENSGYHGVIAIDPVNGTILRLVLEADLKPGGPIARSGISVEYGAVDIGGKTYICPVKSVSIWRTLSAPELRHFHYGGLVENNPNGRNQLQTWLNDVAFEQYHVFRADARLLPEDNAEKTGNPPAPAGHALEPATDANIAPGGPATALIQAPTTAPDLPPPEIMVANAAATPKLPPAPAPTVRLSDSQSPTPTLHVSSRIVYVDIVVRDSRGKIVRGLTQNDFRISEDGASQKVDLFSAFTDASLATTGNSSPITSEAKPGLLNTSSENTSPGTVNIVLFDLLNTSLPSQMYARKQMLKFLAGLPPGYKIAVFVLTDRLHMVQDVTGNSELLAETARLLLPKSSYLFQSGSDQMRSTDILGLLPPEMRTSGFALDLVEELSNEKFQHDQARSEITNNAFRDLAQATAAFPGRKNLLWLSESFPLGALTTLQSAQSSLGSPLTVMNLSGDGATSKTISGSRIAVYPISVAGLETSGVSAAMNGTTAAGGNGSAITGGATAGNGINTVDQELTGGVAAAQPGAQGGARLTDTLGQQASAIEALHNQMEEIATDTGGEASFGNNDIAGALRRSLEGGQNYYSLAYSSTNKKWNGKFRKIQVELARKGYSLSYRRGYFAVPEPPDASVNNRH